LEVKTAFENGKEKRHSNGLDHLKTEITTDSTVNLILFKMRHSHYWFLKITTIVQ